MLVTPTVPPTPILAGVILLVLVYAVALLALLRSSERGRWSPLAARGAGPGRSPAST